MEIIQITSAKSALLLLAISFACISFAQNSKNDSSEKNAASVKALVNSRQYVFKAQAALPLSGGLRQLTGGYDMNVSKDTTQANLPYFGRAYVAPADPTQGGIKFTSTQFDYSVLERKKGGWDVTFKIKDVPDVRQMILTISGDGYASLTVYSNNRQAITFNGVIEDKKSR